MLTGLLIVSVSRSVLGQVVTVRDVLRSGRVWLVVGVLAAPRRGRRPSSSRSVSVSSRCSASDGTSGLAILLGVLGLLAYVVLPFWVSVRTLLAAPALMLEGKGFWPTVARAWRLTRGGFWRLLGIWLLTAVLANIISAIFTVPAQLFTQLFLGDAAGGRSRSIAINGSPTSSR